MVWFFSDESRFCVSHLDGRTRVWRRQGERYADCCVVEHDRWGGGSVTVWAGISSRNRTQLHIFNGIVNAQTYLQDILQGIVVPFFQNNPNLHTYQQDNARAHVARVCNQFLAQQQFNVMQWPPYSCDLSPIEHLWDELGRRVYANHQIHNVQDLRNALTAEWQNIPQADIARLTRSMRRRILGTITARGGHTRY